MAINREQTSYICQIPKTDRPLKSTSAGLFVRPAPQELCCESRRNAMSDNTPTCFGCPKVIIRDVLLANTFIIIAQDSYKMI
jgi:hypothetical protein